MESRKIILYSDDIPKGYDVVYNTNKKSGAPDKDIKDENGFVTVLNSKPLKEEYKKISRDEQGRLKHCSYDEYDETFCNYTVNEAGLLVEMEDWPFMDGGCKTKYTYDDNGDLIQITVEGFDIEGGGTDVIKYVIEERDAHGNWTCRTANGKSQTRTITYYE